MISPEIEEAIEACAREFDVGAVWVFGSSLTEGADARDIDLGIEGLASSRFLRFYSRLFWALPKPVDLVDMSQEPPIAAIIRAKGVRIYER